MLDLQRDYNKTNYKHIYKHKTNGTYAVEFYLYNKLYNKRIRKRKTNFKTISKANLFISKTTVEFEEAYNLNQPKKGGSFKEAYASYIKECELEVKKGNLAKSTVETKKAIFKNQILPILGNVKLIEIKEEHIREFHNDLMDMTCERERDKKLARQTLIKVHKQLSAFLNYCVRNKLIAYNPAGVVGNFGKEKKERDILTQEEFDKLLGVVDNVRDSFILQLLFYTGIRVSELLGLTTNSIITTEQGTSLKITDTYYKGEIRQNKAKTDNSMGELFLDDDTVEAYKAFLEYRNEHNITSKYLFANNIGKCEVIGDRAIRDMIKKYQKQTDITKNITPHTFRHSHAALLIDMGKTLEDIKVRLRHKDIRTTSNEYGHMYKERKILLANELTNMRNQNKKGPNTETPFETPTD